MAGSKSILSRRQRSKLIRFLALLSMVRWYNILAMAVALFLSATFILNSKSNWVHTLLDYRLHLAIAGMSFIIMAGYIINAFYDVEKDLVNNAKATIFGKHVSRGMSFNFYFLFNALGIVLCGLVSWKVLSFNVAFVGVLWFYSHKLRKIPILGELSATTLMITPFACLCLYYMMYNKSIVLYVGFIFAIDITREVVKKLEGLRGDIIYAYGSIVTLLGERQSKYVIYGLMLVTMALIVLLHPIVQHNAFILAYLWAVVGTIVLAFIWLLSARMPKQYSRVHLLYKLIISFAILSIAFI